MVNISWEETKSLVVELSQKIKESEFQPDILIALARGGWVPTRFLSDGLGVKKLSSIGLTYADKERKDLVFYSFPEPINEGEKILLIEDRLETGKSMKVALEALKVKGAFVKTASLFIRTDSIIVPDYFLSTRDENIIFPWE